MEVYPLELLVVKEIMDYIAPVGTIYQAGTLSGNPLAMTSGYETLSQLTPESYEYFNSLGDILEKGLKRYLLSIMFQSQ